MRPDKTQALKMRLLGKSYNEINKSLGVPKATLSDWFTDLQLSDRARRRISARVYRGSVLGLIRRNKNQTRLALQRTRKIREEARHNIHRLTKYELLLAGATLYWAEGYKRPIIRRGHEVTDHPVSLTNSDPKLVLLFLRFLREICEIPDKDIHAEVRIYEHMNEHHVLNFWQKLLNLPLENFGKTYYGVSKSSLGKRPFTRLPYGTILIRVNRTALFHKIMGWIQGIANQAVIV